ncbi:leucine-rich repeat-containing protein 46 [Camarhynchus parvulus]|uniref:leucine-rich repeat-containing protein 46 n=1 Tax=Geospiza parvula TaxID=87175 RepID=UPI0012382813|nr:leucine-rich repeat-containing protein 46 [Camarhynchus parvulus]
MAEQGDALCGAPEEPCPGATLSDSLIIARARSTGPLPTGTIRLDRENICCIGKTRGQDGIHSLYLQQNHIEKMENLECFPNLRFLCLAGNRIQRVQNLRGLPRLSLLDLSCNLIQVLHAEELPRSLRILDLAGNPCTQQEGYRAGVLAALPQLLQLDSQPVQGSAAEEAAGGGSCSSEDEEDEEEELLPALRAPFTADRDFLGAVRRELAARARLRRTLSLEEHRARLEELRSAGRCCWARGSAARPGRVHSGAQGHRRHLRRHPAGPASPRARLCRRRPVPEEQEMGSYPKYPAAAASNKGFIPTPVQPGAP